MKHLIDNIYVLMGKWSSNIYYLDYEKKVLVDAGHPLEVEYNYNVLRDNGVDFDTLDYLIVTHSHGDHIGACAFIKRKHPNIKIISSEYMTKYQNIRNGFDILKGAEDDFENFDVDIIVTDGDEIDLGNDKITIIHTPGHTIDSICLYLNNTKILISGDTLYNKVIPQLDYYQDISISIQEVTNSYEKLMKYDINGIFPGHGDEIHDIDKNFMILMRKLKVFGYDKEVALINNFTPSVEHYIFKNPGLTKSQLLAFFTQNIQKFKDNPYFETINSYSFNTIIDKILSLMKFLQIIRCDGDKLYLTGEINSYLRIQTK